MRRPAIAMMAIGVLGVGSPGCASIVGLGLKCEPTCVDGETRLVCDDDEAAHAETCPQPEETCLRGVCTAGGVCAVEPNDGAACPFGGECDGGVCLGPNVKISALRHHGCVVFQDRSVRCWGENTFGELGDGTRTFQNRPVQVAGLEDAIDVGTGYHTTYAIRADGTIVCWGNNQANQCGVDTSGANIPHPSQVPGFDGVRFSAVKGGEAHTCALSDRQELYCWGQNVDEECGLPASAIVPPGESPILRNVIRFDTIKRHSCALRDAAAPGDRMLCWGNNSFGQLGVDPAVTSSSHVPVPVSLPGDDTIYDFGINYDATFAIGKTDFSLFAWGRTYKGMLGTNDDKDLDVGVFEKRQVLFDGGLAGLKPLTDVSAVLRTDGSDQCAQVLTSKYGTPFVCWGVNDKSELAYGALPTPKDIFPVAHPAPVIPDDVAAVARGENFGCFLPKDDHPRVACWGAGEYMGNGRGHVHDDDTVPVQNEALPVQFLAP